VLVVTLGLAVVVPLVFAPLVSLVTVGGVLQVDDGRREVVLVGRGDLACGDGRVGRVLEVVGLLGSAAVVSRLPRRGDRLALGSESVRYRARNR